VAGEGLPHSETQQGIAARDQIVSFLLDTDALSEDTRPQPDDRVNACNTEDFKHSRGEGVESVPLKFARAQAGDSSDRRRLTGA
jgi:hypothetical protein